MPVDTVSPFLLARAVVRAVDRVSPSFVRITFGGDEIAELGTPGFVFDQRIKLIFPSPGAPLPTLEAAGDEWYQRWLELPEHTRGAMRTYSIRHLRADATATELVVDFVLHLDPNGTGPASLWASSARPGDDVLVLGPRRGRTDGGGIEFDPGEAGSILLAGDETAAPAIARILEDSPAETTGHAFIEVPEAGDILPIVLPRGVEVTWLPRFGREHGSALIPAVLGHLGAASVAAIDEAPPVGDELLWETPTFSGLGEETVSVAIHADRYFWIAGESGVVTTLRRHLVKGLGIDRGQVAFMGYWRRGVAMRA
ncbi:NADPH-dependent ferric siderophore reductase [Microbacteriaceae bacterium SG_E_30_P1]|uniref:NADPH-dependent ferric siderophore reductase n=1 Tax=Antiquaquibacter oligotrophicus TaxID=2880260 RepID=A0ABT6KQK5_9MICO|nr:siderophore-interacting protein [Antiquaquibacter oligotrophicus]MDH6182264.1 NADPH-dependent ferric siderophore reductase [Antiquaquibacter oligotrophicus]UDF12079.1 siderophore-interacting protein [Antiquaquibacter oligotrophicus]